MNKTTKGFTLIELLIVIGILGILAAAVVVVLNPAELLAQARDSQRVQDLASVNSALSLYVASVDGAALTAVSYHSGVTTTTWTCGDDTPAGRSATQSVVQEVDGDGWVPVNFAGISGGSPFSVLPVDPTNSSAYHYCYEGYTDETWELNAYLESTKFATTSEYDSKDGGDDDEVYEIGTDQALDLM